MTQEEVVARYRNLAYSICNQFVRTYRIPKRDVPDLENSLILKLCQLPESYHDNSAGVYTAVKNCAIRWVEKNALRQPFIEADRIDRGEMRVQMRMTHDHLSLDGWCAPSNDYWVIPDETNHERQWQTSLDYKVALFMIGELPGPERTCFTLFHGIGFDRPINVAMICRKLGAGRDWVERKIARAQKILQSRMKRGFSEAGEHRRCQSQS